MSIWQNYFNEISRPTVQNLLLPKFIDHWEIYMLNSTFVAKSSATTEVARKYCEN